MPFVKAQNHWHLTVIDPETGEILVDEDVKSVPKAHERLVAVLQENGLGHLIVAQSTLNLVSRGVSHLCKKKKVSVSDYIFLKPLFERKPRSKFEQSLQPTDPTLQSIEEEPVATSPEPSAA